MEGSIFRKAVPFGIVCGCVIGLRSVISFVWTSSWSPDEKINCTGLSQHRLHTRTPPLSLKNSKIFGQLVHKWLLFYFYFFQTHNTVTFDEELKLTFNPPHTCQCDLGVWLLNKQAFQKGQHFSQNRRFSIVSFNLHAISNGLEN